MRKLILILYLAILATTLSACADTKYGNTPEQQRKNSQESQRELSTDVTR